MKETNQSFKHPEHLSKLSKSIQKWVIEKNWTEFWWIQRYAIDRILSTKIKGEKIEREDLILFAPTAGGKTMAAFLPLLTLTEQENLEGKNMGYEILYISPTKALISQHSEEDNDVTTLADKIGRKVTPWMGDISPSIKNRSWDNPKGPKGILMITPESLEARFVKRPFDIRSRFAALRAVVIDELHVYFESPRGPQLISLLTRLEEILHRKVPRVALSATLGNGSEEDWRRIHQFLRPRIDEESIPKLSEVYKENPEHGIKYDIYVKTHFDVDCTETKDKAREDIAKDIRDIFDTSQTGLVFTNSRREAEKLANLLNNGENKIKKVYKYLEKGQRRKLENKLNKLKKELGTLTKKQKEKFEQEQMKKTEEDDEIWNDTRRYWPHHGSLSQSQRAQAENRMRIKEIPCTLVATTTLELGIDVGEIKEVAQIGPGYSVASLRQRMGRSGRPTYVRVDGKLVPKESDIPKLHLFIRERNTEPEDQIIHRLHLPVFQAVAQICLLRAGKFEAPDLDQMHLSTFVQQLISLTHQCREEGLTLNKARRILVDSGPFHGLARPLIDDNPQGNGMSIFDAVTIRLCTRIPPLIDKDVEPMDGEPGNPELFLTPEGEKVINSNTIYTAFRTPIEYTIKSSSSILGTVGMGSVYGTGDRILFSGRAWEITGIDHKRKNIEVRPASGGKAAYFTGDALSPSEEVVEKMRELYEGKSDEEFLSLFNNDNRIANVCDSTIATLKQGRQTYRDKGLKSLPLLELTTPDGPGKTNVINKPGDIFWFPWVGDKTLKGLAAALRFTGIPASPFRMSIFIQDRTKKELYDKITWIIGNFPPMDDLARRSGTTFSGKFDHYLTPMLWRKEAISSNLGSKDVIIEKLKALKKALSKRGAIDNEKVSNV